MLRNPIPPLILIVALLGLAGAYAFFQSSLVPRYAASRHVLASRSELKIAMRVRHVRGPIAQEDYAMSDVEGVSSSSYRALGRGGLQITIAERPRKTLEDGPNVAYFFQQAAADGVWELRSKPPRGDTSTSYAIDVYQLTGPDHGSHRFTFTDPRYWATTGGHQFTLHLDKNKPVPDLLRMSSTTLVEPRYAKLVDDFRAFGPDSFRKKVAQARARLAAAPG